MHRKREREHAMGARINRQTVLRYTLLFWAGAFMLTPAFGADDTKTPALKKGDRIVFFGDSISTTNRAGAPDGFVTIIKHAIDTANKDLEVETICAGVNGNTVPGLQARVKKDVLDQKPAIVFIFIGVNDIGHWRNKDGVMDPKTTKEGFESGLKEIIGKIRAAGARVILCTAAVFGEKSDGSNERDKVMDEYCDISRKVAAEAKCQLVDIRKAFVDYLKANNTKNKEWGVLTEDKIHLNSQGNQLVAKEMLKTLNVPFVELSTAPTPTTNRVN